MKKITLSLMAFLLANGLFSQTFSTGTIQFFPEYSVKIDVTSSLVTLTQVMPSDRWYSLAFNNNNAMNAGDIIAFINTPNISDRQLIGYEVPSEDAVQSWTTISNTISGNVRTVVSTRALNTGETGDYVFSASAGSINLACSRASSATFTLQSHGGLANAVSTAAYSVTLANDSFNVADFVLYPNPAKGFTNISLPTNLDFGTVKIYDNLGRVVIMQEVSSTSNQIETSKLTTGSYLVVLRTEYGNATKTLLVK
jgi:hypothetical protein